MEIVRRTKKRQQLITNLFSGCQNVQKFSILWLITSPFFDAFIQRCFGVFPKITNGNFMEATS